MQAAFLSSPLVQLVDPRVGMRSQVLRPTLINDNVNRRVVTLGFKKGASIKLRNLRIGRDGAVGINNGQKGMWARFLVEEAENGIRLKSIGHKRELGRDVYLKADLDATAGHLVFGSSEHQGEDTIFTVEAAKVEPPPVVIIDEEELNSRVLTDEEKATFVNDGVLVLRGVVPPEAVADAVRTINHQLGVGGGPWEKDDDGNKLGRASGLQASEPIRDLLAKTPLHGVASQLLGRQFKGGNSGQVALRFPEPVDSKRKDSPPEQWHIDSMNKTPHMSQFMLLAGVALSDQPSDDCGNLHVWRGLHGHVHGAVKMMHEIRERERIPYAVPEGKGDDPWLGQRPLLPETQMSQVHLQPGDIVLAHQKAPHRIGINRSPSIRYQVYFRLSAEGYEPVGDGVEGLWRKWQVGDKDGSNEKEHAAEHEPATACDAQKDNDVQMEAA